MIHWWFILYIPRKDQNIKMLLFYQAQIQGGVFQDQFAKLKENRDLESWIILVFNKLTHSSCGPECADGERSCH